MVGYIFAINEMFNMKQEEERAKIKAKNLADEYKRQKAYSEVEKVEQPKLKLIEYKIDI